MRDEKRRSLVRVLCVKRFHQFYVRGSVEFLSAPARSGVNPVVRMRSICGGACRQISAKKRLMRRDVSAPWSQSSRQQAIMALFLGVSEECFYVDAQLQQGFREARQLHPIGLFIHSQYMIALSNKAYCMRKTKCPNLTTAYFR
jgi:hypothetical protein